MDQNYLIPANSKKSLLIFGLFRKEELILFGSCLGFSLFALTVIPLDNTVLALIAVSPALIGGFLVLPVPNYHNVLTVIISAYQFFFHNQEYKWKGWCFLNGKDEQ